MSYQQRDNSGTLFRNERREKGSQPNARGTAMVDGVLYEISSWTKEGAKGKLQTLRLVITQALEEYDKAARPK